MGGYFSSEFAIYGRLLEDDKYHLIEEVKEGTEVKSEGILFEKLEKDKVAEFKTKFGGK